MFANATHYSHGMKYASFVSYTEKSNDIPYSSIHLIRLCARCHYIIACVSFFATFLFRVSSSHEEMSGWFGRFHKHSFDCCVRFWLHSLHSAIRLMSWAHYLNFKLIKVFESLAYGIILMAVYRVTSKWQDIY